MFSDGTNRDPLFTSATDSSSSVAPTWQQLSSWNPVFRIYATHACLLVLKILLMGVYTNLLRFKKQVK